MEKYKVSQELMNAINDWRDRVDGLVVSQDLTVSSDVLPSALKDWWLKGVEWASEKNNRLIALIRYVNGEEVFDVEKPKKLVVRTRASDVNGNYHYLRLIKRDGAFTNDVVLANSIYLDKDAFFAKKFDTKEEAEKWTNPLMEAVEVEDD